VPADLSRVGPVIPVRLLDRRVRQPHPLGADEFDDLVAFIREGLLDPRVNARNLCQLIPAAVPSGRPVLQFESCR
jgi:hypothetical protein